MAAFQKVDGRTGLDEHENLSGFFHGEKVGDGLLDAIIENMKALARQTFDKFSRGIGDEDAHVNAINAYADGF